MQAARILFLRRLYGVASAQFRCRGNELYLRCLLVPRKPLPCHCSRQLDQEVLRPVGRTCSLPIAKASAKGVFINGWAKVRESKTIRYPLAGSVGVCGLLPDFQSCLEVLCHFVEVVCQILAAGLLAALEASTSENVSRA